MASPVGFLAGEATPGEQHEELLPVHQDTAIASMSSLLFADVNTALRSLNQSTIWTVRQKSVDQQLWLL